MNNESENTDGVESLLGRFGPAAPPADFMERLRAARPVLSPVAAPRRAKVVAFPFLPHLTAAAAAIVAGLATWHFMKPAVDAPGPDGGVELAGAEVKGMAPQQSTQRLMGVLDMGIARDEQRRPVRLMRATWIDDDIYPHSGGQQPVREARVREEIVPVVLNDF